jgi:hypothetical protein
MTVIYAYQYQYAQKSLFSIHIIISYFIFTLLYHSANSPQANQTASIRVLARILI